MLTRILILILACLGVMHVWHWLTPERQQLLAKKAIWASKHDFLNDLQKWRIPRGSLVYWANKGVDLVNSIWYKLPGFLFCVLALIVIMIVYKLITKEKVVW
jgi:hypothetical protein